MKGRARARGGKRTKAIYKSMTRQKHRNNYKRDSVDEGGATSGCQLKRRSRGGRERGRKEMERVGGGEGNRERGTDGGKEAEGGGRGERGEPRQPRHALHACWRRRGTLHPSRCQGASAGVMGARRPDTTLPVDRRITAADAVVTLDLGSDGQQRIVT